MPPKQRQKRLSFFNQATLDSGEVVEPLVILLEDGTHGSFYVCRLCGHSTNFHGKTIWKTRWKSSTSSTNMKDHLIEYHTIDYAGSMGISYDAAREERATLLAKKKRGSGSFGPVMVSPLFSPTGSESCSSSDSIRVSHQTTLFQPGQGFHESIEKDMMVALTAAFAVGSIPYRFADNLYFQKFLSKYVDYKNSIARARNSTRKRNFPEKKISSHTLKQAISEESSKIFNGKLEKHIIENDELNFPVVTLATDGWTRFKEKIFNLGLVCNGVSYYASGLHFQEHEHTSNEAVMVRLFPVIEALISSKKIYICAVVSDNESLAYSLCKSISKKFPFIIPLRDPPHTFQLVLSDIKQDKTFSKILEICDDIANCFSLKEDRVAFKKMLKERNMKYLPFYRRNHRWNSSLRLLKTIFEYNTLLNNFQKTRFIISTKYGFPIAFFHDLAQIISIFEPITNATFQTQADSSNFIVVDKAFRECEEKLQICIDSHDESLGTEFSLIDAARSAMASLRRRSKNFSVYALFAKCLCFEIEGCITSSQLDAIESIFKTWGVNFLQFYFFPSIPKQQIETEVKNSFLLFLSNQGDWKIRDSDLLLEKRSEKIKTVNEAIEYFNLRRAITSTQKLALLAIAFLKISPQECSIERMFASQKDTQSDLRQGLNESSVNNEMRVKYFYLAEQKMELKKKLQMQQQLKKEYIQKQQELSSSDNHADVEGNDQLAIHTSDNPAENVACASQQQLQDLVFEDDFDVLDDASYVDIESVVNIEEDICMYVNNRVERNEIDVHANSLNPDLVRQQIYANDVARLSTLEGRASQHLENSRVLGVDLNSVNDIRRFMPIPPRAFPPPPPLQPPQLQAPFPPPPPLQPPQAPLLPPPPLQPPQAPLLPPSPLQPPPPQAPLLPSSSQAPSVSRKRKRITHIERNNCPCKDTSKNRGEWVACEVCMQWYHRSCTDWVTPEGFEDEDDASWSCLECR